MNIQKVKKFVPSVLKNKKKDNLFFSSINESCILENNQVKCNKTENYELKKDTEKDKLANDESCIQSSSDDDENVDIIKSIMFRIKPKSNISVNENSVDAGSQQFCKSLIIKTPLLEAPPKKHYVWGSKKRQNIKKINWTLQRKQVEEKQKPKNSLWPKINSNKPDKQNLFPKELEFFQFPETNADEEIICNEQSNLESPSFVKSDTDLDEIFKQKLSFSLNKKLLTSKPTDLDKIIQKTELQPTYDKICKKNLDIKVIFDNERTQVIDIDALLEINDSDIEENNDECFEIERITKENTYKNKNCLKFLQQNKEFYSEHKTYTKNGETTFSASPEPFLDAN